MKLREVIQPDELHKHAVYYWQGTKKELEILRNYVDAFKIKIAIAGVVRVKDLIEFPIYQTEVEEIKLAIHILNETSSAE